MSPTAPPRLRRLQRAITHRLRQRSFSQLATLAVALAVGTALLHVSIRMQVLRVGYALSEETRAHHDLVQQNQRLRLELATRKNPAMIERLARERLRMSPPDPAAIRVIERAPRAPAPVPAAPTAPAAAPPAGAPAEERRP